MPEYSFAQLLARSSELDAISDSSRLDVELLLSAVSCKDRSYFFTWPEKIVSQSEVDAFELLFSRRLAGEPIALILGKQGFWDLDLFVDSSTLIPRPDTEVLVERALELVTNDAVRILDLGTGTGAIALAFAKELPKAKVEGVDASNDAVNLAKRNQANLQITNCQFYLSNWFSTVEGLFDLIVSNPPYIEADDVHLTKGDVRFEPRSALVAGEDGLDDIRIIVDQSRKFLNKGAYLILEHGWQQGDAVRALLAESGFEKIGTQIDYGSNERASYGSWSGSV